MGKTRAPLTGKNIWRLCKVYGRLIGFPELKPHDVRHGVAMEVYEQHHDLEEVRALLSVHRRRQNERVNRVVAEDLAVRPGILRIGEAGTELLSR